MISLSAPSPGRAFDHDHAHSVAGQDRLSDTEVTVTVRTVRYVNADAVRTWKI